MAAKAGLSPKEFARAVGASDASIYRWLRTGVVKGVRIGPRKILIPSGEVERILNQGTSPEDSVRRVHP